MKIVHVTEAWSGGISTYVNTLLRHQAADSDVTALTLLHSATQTAHDFDSDFYKSQSIATRPYESSRNPFKIHDVSRNVSAIIKELNPDIVHLHSTFPGVYGRAFKQKNMTAKVVYCAHGWSFVQERGRAKKLIYAQIEKYLARRTDAIINISHHEDKEAEKHGVRALLNKVVLSGVDDVKGGDMKDRFDASPALDIDPSFINIGYVGRLDHKKGFDMLADVFDYCPPVNVRLYVMGDSSRDQQERPQNVTDQIKYLGWVDHDAVHEYMSLLDAVIVPSRQEGFGLVAVEAMRAGKPVIASRVGALPELVQHGENGYLFDIKDYKQDLSDILGALKKDELNAMGARARNIYEQRFTSARFSQEVLDCYRSLLPA